MSLLATLSMLEEDDDVHLGRLLVLLGTFAGRDGSHAVEGLTKLAKLDFLLRYPVYLERALERRAPGEHSDVADHERQSVESRMIRYRYGPWDHRYRRFVNLLVGKGLTRIAVVGRTVNIHLTSTGATAAAQLIAHPTFADQAQRARVLKRHFDLSGSTLKNFVYATFPEIVTLRLGEEIDV